MNSVLFRSALALLASAPAAAAQGLDPGERAFSYCFSCHSVDPKETGVMQGPLLKGVIGRPVASREGFAYSPAMKAFAAGGKTWTPELILQFIQDPAALVPGTAMQKPPGPRSDADRAALIGYMKQHP
jgi:cytochrome c